MTTQNTRAGIWLMIAAVFTFSLQDALSRHLAESYNTMMVVTLRYWAFAAFVVLLAARRQGGLRRGARTMQPGLHLARSVFLVAEVCVIVTSYTIIGLINTHAVFACCPLIIAALSGPLLGEKVSLRQWMAIGVGFAGVLIILQPGSGVFSAAALLPLISALMYALYSLMTRRATQREDAFQSLFWSGVFGAVLMTPLGLWFWQPMSPQDWGWMALYSTMAVGANWLVIRCYDVAEASEVQPFAYLQIVFVSMMGIAVFGETLAPHVALGVAVVVAAGLVTLTGGRRRGGQVGAE